MVRPFERPAHSGNHKFPEWTLWCDGCGFSDTHPEASMSIPDRAEAIKYARQLVRAELARQALEMRAHSQARNGVYDEHGTWTGALVLDEAASMVMDDYNWLGAHPLRLPGEGA